MTYLAPADSELTLACWASNSVGRQEIPCLIHIIPASKFSFQDHRRLTYIIVINKCVCVCRIRCEFLLARLQMVRLRLHNGCDYGYVFVVVVVVPKWRIISNSNKYMDVFACMYVMYGCRTMKPSLTTWLCAIVRLQLK